MKNSLYQTKIQVSGPNTERFLNLCVQNNILFQDIKTEYYKDETSSKEEKILTATLNGLFANELQPLADKAGVELTIQYEKGILSKILYYRKRFWLFFFPIFFIVYFIYVNQFIWGIEVEGNQRLTKDMLLSFLEEEEQGYGTPKAQIDPVSLAFHLRQTFPFVTWVNIVVEGNCLKVRLKENDLVSYQNENGSLSANIVSSDSGTIVSILVRNGTPLVKCEETVSCGDILIDSAIPVYDEFSGEQIDSYFVRADGDVFIETTCFLQFYEPYLITEKIYLPDSSVYHYLFWKNHLYSFYPEEETEDTDRYTSCYQLCLGEDFYLPIYYGTITERPFDILSSYRDESELEERLLALFEKEKDELIRQNWQILSEKIHFERTADGISLIVTMTVIKPTGVLQENILEDNSP